MSRVPIPSVQLHNIRDAAAFVTSTLSRTNLTVDDTEREDLIAEGLAVLIEMANAWKPERHGNGTGSFYGYASTYLPRRLIDAWHRNHREHTYATLEDGTRRWEYGHAPDSIYDSNGDPLPIVGTSHHPQLVPTSGYYPGDTIAQALTRVPAEYRICALPVLRHLDDGYSLTETARHLSMTVRDVDQIRGAVSSAVHSTLMEAA